MKESINSDFFNQIMGAIHAMTAWEIVAVILAILYLWLAMRQNIWCWVCGFFSTAIYLYLFWKVSLLSESLLQIFYLVLSIYGWIQWRKGSHHVSLPVVVWSNQKHFITIIITSLLTVVIGYFMAHYTQAKFPYLDAATSTFAVVTTYMVTQKVLENWFYWIIIDSLSIYLYSSRGLYLTALLFMLYIMLCFFGYRSWKIDYNQEKSFAKY